MAARVSANPNLVFGLGNPGKDYAGNRHNIGRIVVLGLARELGVELQPAHPRAEFAEAKVDSHKCLLAVGKDYMNTSGRSVGALLGRFSIAPHELLVVHDDLDLPKGTIRLKAGGGSGGHNGLKSIIDILGTDEFPRLRMGIGRPPGKTDPAEFVLSDFNAVEWAEMEFAFMDAISAIKMILTDGFMAAMNKFNRKPEAGTGGAAAGGCCE